MTRSILSVLVENQAGVLNRLTSLFSRRGYNIDSITVGVTSNPEVSRITVVVSEDTMMLEQIVKQLEKQIVVKKVKLLDLDDALCREMLMIKLNREAASLETLSDLIDRPGNRVVNLGVQTITMEVTGSQAEIDELLSSIDRHLIVEMARTGMIAMERGDRSLTE